MTVLIIFGATLGFDFLNWDDDKNIVKNSSLLAGALGVFWKNAYYGLYVPVTYTAWGALAQVSASPMLFHATNVVLHAVNATLLYRWIEKRLSEQRGTSGVHWPALAGALFFAIHPLQVGAVAWVSGFRDLLSAMFSFLALTVFWERRTFRAYLVASALFVLAFLAKPSVIVLPVAVFVFSLAWESGSRERAVSVGRRLVPWILLSLPVPLLTHLSQVNYGVTPEVPWADRPWIALDALGFYLKKLALPLDLGPDYGRTPAWVMENQTFWATSSIFIFFALVVSALWWRKKLPKLALGGLLWSGVFIGPVLGLMPFAYQYTSTVADHYMYLPLAGFAMAFSGALDTLRTRRSGLRRAIGAVLGIYFFAYGVLSFQQSKIWANDGVFFRRMLEQNPGSFHAHISLGNLEFNAGNYEPALTHYRRASEISPINAAASANIVVTLGRLGRYEEIIRLLAAPLSDPRKIKWAHETAPYYTVLYYILGAAQGRLGMLEESRIALCRALAMDPKHGDSTQELANLREPYRRSRGQELPPCASEEWGQ